MTFIHATMALRYVALARDTAPGSTRPGFVEIPERILRIARALAAASQLTGNDVTTDDQNVVACGEQYACANGVSYQPAGTCYGIPSCTTAASSDTMTVTPADDDRSVTVHIQRSVPYFFFRILGLKKGTVVVQATAGIYPTSGACNVVPLSLPCTAAVSGGSGYGGDGSMGTGDRSCGGGSGNGPYASGKSVTLVSDWQHIPPCRGTSRRSLWVALAEPG